jgi:hypothetical protein
MLEKLSRTLSNADVVSILRGSFVGLACPTRLIYMLNRSSIIYIIFISRLLIIKFLIVFFFIELFRSGFILSLLIFKHVKCFLETQLMRLLEGLDHHGKYEVQ